LSVGTTDDRISELIRAVTTKLQQITEKPPCFYEGFSSSIIIGTPSAPVY
jgi:hypothetical protein